MKKILFYIFLFILGWLAGFILAFLLSHPEVKAQTVFDKAQEMTGELNFNGVSVDSVWATENIGTVWIKQDTIAIVYLPKILYIKFPIRNTFAEIYNDQVHWRLGFKIKIIETNPGGFRIKMKYYNMLGKEIDKPQVYFEINKD